MPLSFIGSHKKSNKKAYEKWLDYAHKTIEIEQEISFISKLRSKLIDN